MSIQSAANAMRRFFNGEASPIAPSKALGLVVRPSLHLGAAEVVVRFADGSHQVLALTPERGIAVARDLLDIAVHGASRR